MTYNLKSKEGQYYYKCEVCGCMTFKKPEHNKYACSYCKTRYTFPEEVFEILDVVKNELGKYPYK